MLLLLLKMLLAIITRVTIFPELHFFLDIIEFVLLVWGECRSYVDPRTDADY